MTTGKWSSACNCLPWPAVEVMARQEQALDAIHWCRNEVQKHQQQHLLRGMTPFAQHPRPSPVTCGPQPLPHSGIGCYSAQHVNDTRPPALEQQPSDELNCISESFSGRCFAFRLPTELRSCKNLQKSPNCRRQPRAVHRLRVVASSHCALRAACRGLCQTTPYGAPSYL